MSNSIDSFLGLPAQALSIESRRTQLLAAKLANVDTPNFKARDLDFKAALANAGASATSTLPLRQTNTNHQSAADNSPTAVNDKDSALRYRVPLAPSLDGNTVDEQLEQAAFAENAVRYQATLTLLNTRLRGLMTAITGQ